MQCGASGPTLPGREDRRIMALVLALALALALAVVVALALRLLGLALELLGCPLCDAAHHHA